MANNFNKLKFTELICVAKTLSYYPPQYKEDEWTTEDIYHAALHETLQSRYQIRASEIICNVFPPLKLLFKNTLRNYIKLMMVRSKDNVNANELSF